MNRILILIFIFYLLFIFYNNIKKVYRKKVVDLAFWRDKYQKHHNELLELIKKVIPYLEKWKITYWCHAGTLLGYVRHKGFIPWDDDVDFGYIDNGNIKNFIIDLKNNGFQINYKILGIELDFKHGFQIIDKTNYKMWIDMFKFTHKNNMLLQTKQSNINFPRENYYYNDVFPLKKCNFNNIQLPIPNKSHRFCNRAYSSNYKNEFYVNIPHPFTFMSNIIDGFGINLISKEKFYIKDLIN